jgi:hypothetical protein
MIGSGVSHAGGDAAGMPTDQGRPALAMVAGAVIISEWTSFCSVMSGFRFSDPQIDIFSVPDLGFRDCLISTMKGRVCFAIRPPAGESLRYDSLGIDRHKRPGIGVLQESGDLDRMKDRIDRYDRRP